MDGEKFFRLSKVCVYRQVHEKTVIALKTLGDSIDEPLKQNVSFISVATSDEQNSSATGYQKCKKAGKHPAATLL
jgi:hypothetical protein